jgi:predicted amidohydrolase
MSIKIVNPLGEEESSTYIAIGHINVYMRDKRKNLENARKTLLIAHENHVDTLILPYMQPYGPILNENIAKTTLRKKYGLSIYSGYLSVMSILAKNYGVDILITGAIEKTGSKLYLASFLIPGTIGEPIEKYRKIILSEREKLLGFERGRSIKRFKCRILHYSVVLDNEILYPELVKLHLYTGSDIVFIGMAPDDPVKNYLSIIKSVALMTKSMLILVGGRYYYEDKLVYDLPTIIVDEKGDIVFKYYEDREQALILLPINKLVRNGKVIDQETIFIHALYSKLLIQRKRRARVGVRKGYSDQA